MHSDSELIDARASAAPQPPDWRERLDRDGYVVFADVLAQDELARMRARCEALLEREGCWAGAIDPTPYQLRLSGPMDTRRARLRARLYRAALALVLRSTRLAFRWQSCWRTALLRNEPQPPVSDGWRGRLWAELRGMVHVEVHQEAPGVRRVADLVNKGAEFDVAYTHPRVMRAVEHVLGASYKLSSLNLREPRPGAGAQPLHVDWPHSTERGEFYACNTLWVLDDYEADNGATRVVPGSHLWRQTPAQGMADPQAAHPQEVRLRPKAGSVIVLNSHVWHGGTPNRSGARRRILQSYFAHRAATPQLCQRAYIRPETWHRVGERARWVLDVTAYGDPPRESSGGD